MRSSARRAGKATRWQALFKALGMACLLAGLALPAPSSAAAKRKKSKSVASLAAASGAANTQGKTAASRANKSNKPSKTTQANATPVHDAELMAIYAALAEGKLSQALAQADALVLKAPNFSLGHLLKADILNAKAHRPAPDVTAHTQASLLGTSTAARRMTELRAEAQLRLLALQHPPQAAQLPSNLLAIAPDIPRVLVLDALRSRLYVYENSASGLYLSRSLYVTQGRLGANKMVEGDQKTPIGIYFSDGAIEKKLPDLYGFGALNTDYPNVWDKRQNRTGHGIWLHGTPRESYARAPYASDGCVVLSNADLAQLFPLMGPKVPVVLAENLKFLPAQQVKQQALGITDRINAWAASVAQGQASAMAGFYAADFSTDALMGDETKNGQTLLAAWLARKTNLAADQAAAMPKIVGLTAIAYPNETDVMHTRFELHYPAKAAASPAKKTPKITKNKSAPAADGGLVLRKTLYWKKQDGQWFITLETAGMVGAL